LALVLNAEIGDPAANAYADVAEANEQLAYRLGAASWEGADDDVKIQSLVTAARDLDALPLYGVRASDTQALEFPRTGTDENGVVLPADDIPYLWWLANIEYAFWLSAHQTTSAVDLLNPAVRVTKRAKSGDDEVEFFAPTSDQADATSIAQFPPAVQRLIARFVYDDVPALWGSASVTRSS
jgi:hypothetical protein